MSEFAIDVQEWKDDPNDPQVTFVLQCDGQDVLRKEARILSEEDIIAASDAIVRASNGNGADIDQWIAQTIEPIRIRWLRERDAADQEPAPNQKAQTAREIPPRYVAVVPTNENGA